MNEPRSDAAVPVLLVEDDLDDVAITRRAFEVARFVNPLHVVRDGEEAMEFLQHTGRHADQSRAPRPGLIILDLNLPRLDGREVLRRIKADPQLESIPVVVLTTSGDKADVHSCYELGADTYVEKPVRFDEFLKAIATLQRYWLWMSDVKAS